MRSHTCKSRWLRQWVWGLAAAVTLVAMMVAVSGCNTMEGAGRDIQRAGEEVEDAAD